MSKRKLTIVLALMCATLFMTAAASADTLSGTGWVHAHGNGKVAVRGQQLDTFYVNGNGTLLYKDEGEPDEPVVMGNGRRIDLPNGWVQYVGFNGSFRVRDADQFIVKLTGQDIDLYAEGSGDIWLIGRGHYHFGNGDGIVSGLWPADGHSFPIAPAE